MSIELLWGLIKVTYKLARNGIYQYYAPDKYSYSYYYYQIRSLLVLCSSKPGPMNGGPREEFSLWHRLKKKFMTEILEREQATLWGSEVPTSRQYGYY